ncbi:MAG TPA: endo-1,4-beta-xylanase, partial [Abditibacteriaceae bacterium]|nr:endo-1,4-beta-xylanase [Abditibacteriaceae bacterium]
LSFGWSTRYEGPARHAFADPRPRIDGTTAAVGRQSLRNDIPEGDNAAVRSPLFSYNFGRAHAMSAWLKASAPNTRVEMNLEGTDISTAVQVGTTWQRFTLNGTLPFRDYMRLRFYCTAPKNGQGVTLWIDGAQVEERVAPSASYLPAAPLELTLTLPRPGKVVFDGEVNRVLVGLSPQAPRGARLQLSMQNVYGARQLLPTVKLPVASFALPVSAGHERGIFKLRGVVVDAKGRALSSPVEMVWARLPRPRSIAPDRSFFGIHIPLSPDFIAIARATGQRRVRLHDTSMISKWAIAESTPGRIEFFDEGVTAARNAGLSILGMLDGAPPHVTTKPRANEGNYWKIWNIPDAPNALSQWRNYVRAVAGHYKGRIDEWEVWNEPWGQWWIASGNPNATPELYGQFLRAAYQEAKAANPNAQIIGIDTFRGYDDNWTKPALKAAGLQFFDVFSFHDYNDAFYGGPDNLAQAQVQTFTTLMRPYGTPRPLWNTEGGPGHIGSFYASETGGLAIASQATYMVRYDVTHMAAGTRNSFLYAMPTDPAMGEPTYCADEFDRAIKPIVAARAVLASLVDGAGVPTRSEPVKGVDFYTFPRLGGQVVSVLWSYDNTPHQINVPRGVRVLDVWGNAIKVTREQVTAGFEPIYFVR